MADFVQIDGEYPRLPDAPELIHKSNPYPFMMYVQADNEYPRIVGLLEVIPIEPPTPYVLYIQADGKFDGYPRLIEAPEFLPFASPLPWLIFGQDRVTLDGYPYLHGVPEIYYHGAFCHANNLKKAIIPISVKYIGPHAFTNTKLTQVTIASDCKYYPTSFPEDCIINFYKDIN